MDLIFGELLKIAFGEILIWRNHIVIALASASNKYIRKHVKGSDNTRLLAGTETITIHKLASFPSAITKLHCRKSTFLHKLRVAIWSAYQFHYKHPVHKSGLIFAPKIQIAEIYLLPYLWRQQPISALLQCLVGTELTVCSLGALIF